MEALSTPIEEIIRRLIKRILADCQAAGTPATETLAAFTIKSVVLNRRHASLLENIRDETDGSELVALCVQRLVDFRAPAAQLIRMQVFFETSYLSRADVLEDHGRTLQTRLAPVMEDIVSVTAAGGDRDELELLYRKVVAFTVLVHGLGDPADDSVEREASAALHSVFPPAELGNFLALKPDEKRQQLGELADIVAGVRLFNRDAGKGGVGIEDVPAFLERAVSATRSAVDEELRHCVLMIARYNAVVRLYAGKLTALADVPKQESASLEQKMPRSAMKRFSKSDREQTDKDKKPEEKLAVDAEDSLSAQFVRICCEVLAHHRQFELYLRLILADIGKVAAQLIELSEAMSSLLKRLHKMIDVSPAVPANLVLPLFVELADAWRGYQVETVCLSTLSTLHTQLQLFMKLYETEEVVPEMWLEERLKEADIVDDSAQVEKYKAQPVKQTEEMTAQILPVDRLKNYSQLPIQYNRLCPHALVDGAGQLLVGDCSLGVAYHNGRYFLCSSPAALQAFATKPDFYSEAVEERARRHPELIHLLSLEEAFAPGERAVAPEPLLLADQSVQTELHPEPPPEDPEFSWNEWQMRRRALLLADLRSRRTHGVQTERSHLRRDTSSQMYPPTGQLTQTTRDDCTKVPQPMKYIHGLRGESDALQGTVDLTPSITED